MPTRPTLLHELLDAAARSSPDEPAVCWGARSLTFATLQEQTVALAAAVAARTHPGATVALLSHNRPEYVVAYYGVPRAGRVLVLLNPRLHPREWADQLGRAKAELLIVERKLLDRLRSVAQPASVPHVVVLDPLSTAAPSWSHLPARSAGTGATAGAPAPDDTAWLLFTSGTTAQPKGVRLTHRSLLAAVHNTAAGRPVGADDVFCTPFPLCHVAGYSVLVHHLHGRPVRLLRRFDAAELVAAVAEQGVTSVSLAPTMVDALLEHLAARPRDVAAVRGRLHRIGYGAAPMSELLLRRVLEVTGCELNQGYGMTELSGNAVFLDAAAHRAALDGRPELLAAAGRPGPLVDVRVVDASDQTVPAGTPGEIVVRGAQVAAGYWHDDGATASAFVDGWFRTGDLGRLDADGVLYVIDRIKDVIVTGGENVSSREVEAVLRTVPGVGDAAVVGVPDRHWGERVCAVLVSAPDGPAREEELVSACRQRLAGFKVPREIVFVTDLPRTSTGKVRKDVLRRQLSRR